MVKNTGKVENDLGSTKAARDRYESNRLSYILYLHAKLQLQNHCRRKKALIIITGPSSHPHN